MIVDLPSLEQAKLSVQRALLGELTPACRVVSVAVTPGGVCVWVYHDGPVSEELEEDLDAAMT
jgi:hypothetical protein